MEKARAVLFGGDVVEARVNTTGKDGDGIVGEVGKEKVRFASLDLTMLSREGSQVVVKLDGLVGSGASLVLRGGETQPEVDIPDELIGDLGSLQNDVGVTVIEVAVLVLGPGNNLEVLNAPDLEALLLSGSLPLLLAGSGSLTDVLLQVSPETGDVGGKDIVVLLLEHGPREGFRKKKMKQVTPRTQKAGRKFFVCQIRCRQCSKKVRRRDQSGPVGGGGDGVHFGRFVVTM